MAHNAEEGNLIFIQEGEKRRPYICVKVYRNKAGIPYNWLVLPITSSMSVGNENLYQIKHPKLHKTSFVKINNIKTIAWDENYEVKNKINQKILDELIDKICKSLNYVKRKIGRSVDE